ncbi:MAG: MarC family protein [Planctomycetota bacterium]|jgi:multiple antibiotic resistance protein
MIDYVATFIAFFAVIDPIGTVPVFLAVTSRHEASERRMIAIRATVISAIILVFFVAVGEVILNAMDIPLAAFQVAGGIILFLFAFTMIFGESKPEGEVKMLNARETAVHPLAVPSIASPGAMLAAVLLTDNAQVGIGAQIQVTVVMLSVLVVALVLMLLASPLHRLIGDGGAAVVSRVMGMILAAVAMTNVLAGIREYFGLP